MENRNGREGFSLIEVVIAVAVLGILTVPILAYFSNAAISTSKGKDTQKAGMAGQSLTEEINSYTDFSQLEALNGENGWSLDEPITSGQPVKLSKELTIDGTVYQGKVQIDYDYPASASVTPNAKYNSYSEPQLEEVYSDSNVVAVESDQISSALSEFYYYDTSSTKETILNNMSRAISIGIDVDTEDSTLYNVALSYDFKCTVKGTVRTYHTNILSTKIQKDKLKNIYLFYQLVNEATMSESVNMTVGAGVDINAASNINLHFITQKTTFTRKDGYNLQFTGTGSWNNMTCYTNGFSTNMPNNIQEIVSHQVNGKRIAKVTVDIYDEKTTSFSDDERLAHIETSKGE